MKKINLFIVLIILILSCTKDEIKVTEIETIHPHEITSTSVVLGGDITSTGNPDVSERGVCWSTSVDPTTANEYMVEGNGLGNYSVTVTGLIPTTTYFVRAYAKVNSNTVYGHQKEFTTLEEEGIPSVNTLVVNEISTNSAECGGEIISNGGSPIIVKGVCWSTSENPTIEGNTTENGTGDGSFTSIISGLEAATTYYVRAYAKNDVGVGYGEQEAFTSLCDGGILNGDVTLETQGQIDSFGANCYTAITGNLLIEETVDNDITDLTPLNNLESIGGFLRIIGNDSLTSIEGLNTLESIGTWMTIGSNSALINLNGLTSLTAIGGNIYIGENATLNSINILNSLNHVAGGLVIRNCATLNSLDGLNNIESIEEILYINNNASLNNINQLSSIVFVGDELQITDNENLTNLCGLTTLIVDGNLVGNYTVNNNAYNPTQQNIIDGNCSL